MAVAILCNDGSPKIGYNFCFLALITSIWDLANFWSTYLKVAWSQKVFWLWPHCQQKVPNYSPEQKIWISCLLLIQIFCSGEWFGTLAFVGNGTKYTIPSEIKPPLIKEGSHLFFPQILYPLHAKSVHPIHPRTNPR